MCVFVSFDVRTVTKECRFVEQAILSVVDVNHRAMRTTAIWVILDGEVAPSLLDLVFRRVGTQSQNLVCIAKCFQDD